MNEKRSVFIAEDDLLSAEYLKKLLEREGYTVSGVADSAEETVRVCKKLKPDAVLMDIMLKGSLTGTEAALQIRQFLPSCKIIFLTAYAESEMIEYAEMSRAYAYLMKPYREQEILATLRVALTHDGEEACDGTDDLIELKNGFFFDTNRRRLIKNGKEIPLTSKKLRLIELLAKNKNSTVSNEQICLQVWSEIKSDNTLRSLIHRFRNAIGDDIITNVNGVGYSVTT
ncbi:response regulator [Hydrogenimonas sp.]